MLTEDFFKERKVQLEEELVEDVGKLKAYEQRILKLRERIKTKAIRLDEVCIHLGETSDMLIKEEIAEENTEKEEPNAKSR